jgi:predicted hotdog family 3-hydroxylacyl-ACP dehydratase
MLDRTQLSALIPHAGSMCLLDSVVEWTAEWIRCETLTHRDSANPLRRRNALAALHLIEYGAQAMAIHGALVQGALVSQSGPQPGMLGALRDIRLHRARIDDIAEPLSITATRRLARSDGLIYDFVVVLRDSPTRTLCEGRISVVLHAGQRVE